MQVRCGAGVFDKLSRLGLHANLLRLKARMSPHKCQMRSNTHHIFPCAILVEFAVGYGILHVSLLQKGWNILAQ